MQANWLINVFVFRAHCCNSDGVSKENLHFDDQSFFLLWCFLKEIENMFSMFLSSYRNTGESLGKLEKAVETLAYDSCSHSIPCFPKLLLMFL